MRTLTGITLLKTHTLVGALEILSTLDKVQPIAGGTDLIPLIREVESKSTHFIDIYSIKELNGIYEESDSIIIGSTTTHSQLLSSKTVSEKIPALHDACSLIGSIQIRNRGTIGGNLCNASPAADSAPPLLVHDAEVNVSSLSKNQWMPLEEFFKGPKISALKSDELLIGIKVPISGNGCSAFKRIGRRKSFTLSIVNAAAFVERDGDSIKNLRLSIGSVAPTPLRMKKVEKEFIGSKLNHQTLTEIGQACSGQVNPIDDVRGTAEYRRDISSVLIKRALIEAWSRTGGK
ncbi:xanthine dehydrogenase family protein subunit M [Candidatus Bathyarchaeota archaeon]|nr:xanthine dehydrogenase family protein subunit M [Candidatus Bathyarchaeota archaeon]